MNNQKMNYYKKYKTVVKCFIIVLPILLLLIACIFPTKQINNTYALEETTTTQEIQYKYSLDPLMFEESENIDWDNLIINHNYYYLVEFYGGQYTEYNKDYSFISEISNNLPSNISNIKSITGLFMYSTSLNDSVIDEIIYDEYNSQWYNKIDELRIYQDSFIVLENQNFYIIWDDSEGDWFRFFNGYYLIKFEEDFLYNNLYFDYFDIYVYDDIETITNYDIYTYIPKETTINTTNNTYNQETLTQINETKQPNENILKPVVYLYDADINNWYDNILDFFNLNSDDVLYSYLLHFPLYVLWFELLSVILDIFILVPKLFDKWIHKLRGDDA